MKKINSIYKVPFKSLIISLIMIPLMWSCDYLDYSEQDFYQQDDIFYYQGRVQNILNNIYTYLPKDFNSVDGAIRSSATDDALHVWDMSDIQKFNDGSWNSTMVLDDVWDRMYAGIRTANVFLKEAPDLTFPDTKYNQGYEDGMKAYRVYPYEARFLRAFFYFELIKRYKNVPLITDLINDTKEANNVSPASFDEIVQFILDECDACAANLPVTFSTFISGQTGRATKGAALALKARTLLYAASPLHNTGDDQSKWIAAATAAKHLIDTLGVNYMPLAAYTTVVNNLGSKELIFETRQADDRAFEVANTAIGLEGGNTGTCPTQNLVDAYEMKATGLGIDKTGSGYDPATPYATSGAAARDPRLAMTILYNGAIWKTQSVQTYYGGINAPPTPYATKTGYYLKKYMVESISLSPTNPGVARHVWVIFRYAEILLNYAEAMNEAYGPEVAGPGALANMTALQAVNIVRARTGVAMPPFPAGMSQAAFRTKLMNERRVELAFEDHRFWDIRRWKTGNQTTVITGVDISRDESNNLTFVPKVVETRVWDDRMNLYPIPQSEYFINNKLGQNPGW